MVDGGWAFGGGSCWIAVNRMFWMLIVLKSKGSAMQTVPSTIHHIPLTI